MEDTLNKTIHKHFWRIIFAILLIVLAILLFVLVFNVRGLYRSGMLRPSRGFHRSYTNYQLANPGQIQNWMSFSYINRVFNLAPSYLSTSLNIEDSHYPNLTIGQYVKNKNLSDADFLKQIQESVYQYLRSTK